MRRILWLLTAAVALLLVLCASFKFLELRRPDRGITLKAFERIQEGMTEAEVERIFGCPAGNYAPEYERDTSGFRLIEEIVETDEKEWCTRGLLVSIKFSDGRIVHRQSEKTYKAGPSGLLDEVLYRLGYYAF